MRVRINISLFVSLVVFAIGAGRANAQQLDRYIVTIQGPTEQATEAIARSGGVVDHVYQIVPAVAMRIPAAAVPGLARNPLVRSIVPDVTIYADEVSFTEVANTWGVVRIGAVAVQEAGNSGGGVKVAVIDSGIDDGHSELSDCYAGGYDFVNDDDDPWDDNGHGTHVAGTIAAAANGTGVVGAAPSVQLCALKVLGAGGSGSFSDVIAALDWCVANGVKITNNSYGSSSDPGTAVEAAFSMAYLSGILNVCSAGNTGNPAGRGDKVGYPARYLPCIAVAASDSSDRRASFSSTGPDVELIAPGVAIYSTIPGDLYATYNGTSMASPHVAGAAALVWAADLSLSNDDVRFYLCDTAEDLGLSAAHQGFGLVRADAAVAAIGTGGGGDDGDSGTVCVSDLDGTALSVNKKKWKALVNVTVSDGQGRPVSGATVSGHWDSGATTIGITASDGVCTVSSSNLDISVAMVAFTIDDVAAPGYTYVPAYNYDMDGDSDGTTITVP